MTKHDEITAHIREQVESTFRDMLTVIAGHKKSTPKIDDSVEQIWLDFQAELKDFFKKNKLTTATLRAPYLQQGEAYFFQLVQSSSLLGCKARMKEGAPMVSVLMRVS